MKYLDQIIYLLVGIFVIGLHSCKQKETSFIDENLVQGTWIGGAFKHDKGFYIPSNYVLEFKKDTLYFKNLKGTKSFKNGIQFSKDSITLDTTSYPIRKFYIKNDQLSFLDKIEAHRLIETKTINVQEFEDFLLSKDWQINNESGVFRFSKEEKRLQFINTNSNEYHTYCYEFITFQNALFLIKKGNQLACDQNYQFWEQVLSYDENNIYTFGFRDGGFKKIQYTSVRRSETEIKPVSFQLCNQYINKNFPGDRYYYQGTSYNGRLYHIRKIFKENYKVPDGSTESGIFQVRFVVNCEGKAGMYETQAFDTNYQHKEFSAEVANQIFEITKNLQDWIPGRKPKSDKAIDTYIYLSFRIKNGKIIRIYP
ncbi:hypothetical protein [Aquimarina megaterium]|uniref:hypothetical protein n=1 Tax=Aquimarina megaterium TaxID=1443666 RepID=UPI00047238DB|nr:hypothetical protein [Aquimarina megaterium]